MQVPPYRTKSMARYDLCQGTRFSRLCTPRAEVDTRGIPLFDDNKVDVSRGILKPPPFERWISIFVKPSDIIPSVPRRISCARNSR